MSAPTSSASLAVLLKHLRLPGFAAHYARLSETAERQGWTFQTYLRNLAEIEVEERRRRRVQRHLKASLLLPDKTRATLDLTRFSLTVQRQFAKLIQGDFVDRAINVLAFGLPGRGKTHLLCALGHKLIEDGRRVLFTPTFRLVQRLLAAKRELKLEAGLKRLDAFDAVIIDDLGYVQQDREEMEVLFTFLAHRYERRSVLISSNLVFSEWTQIFKDPMTTAAAIDRVVHHSVILELVGGSVRAEEALKNAQKSRDIPKVPPVD